MKKLKIAIYAITILMVQVFWHPLRAETKGVPPSSAACSINAPHFNDFESDSLWATPTCWTQGLKAGFGLPGYSNVGDALVYSGTRALEISNGFGTDTIMAITPRLNGLDQMDKQISFYAATYSFVEDLIIGTMADTLSLGQFIPIDTISISTISQFNKYTVRFDSLSGYNGTDMYIAFLHGNSASTAIFIDDFSYEMIPACPDVNQANINAVSDTSATISFSAQDSLFNFHWGVSGFNPLLGGIRDTADKPFTINGLQSNTDYDVYIQTNCALNGLSQWTGPYTFTTRCIAKQAPYSNNFDGGINQGTPDCWDNALRGLFNNSQAEIQSNPPSAYSGNEHLIIAKTGNSNPGDTTMIITPRFSDLIAGDKQIRFVASAIFGDETVVVGTLSDPGKPGNFTVLDSFTVVFPTTPPPNTQSPNSPIYTEFVVRVDAQHNYNMTDQYIGIYSSTHGAPYSFLYIDDFFYEAIPACNPPLSTSLILSSKTDTKAILSWGASQGVNTKIEWGAVGFTPGQSSIGNGTTSSNTFTINGLSPSTAYEAYLQDSCIGGLTYYVGPISFTTACLPLTAPFTENFDGANWTPSATPNTDLGIIDNCWDRNRGPITSYMWYVGAQSTPTTATGPSAGVGGSGNYIFTESTFGYSGDEAYFYTPFVDVSTLSNPYFQFYYHRYGQNIGDMEVEISDGASWKKLLSFSGQEQIASLNPFTQIGIEIGQYADTVQLRIKAISAWCCEGDMAIDQFSFIEAPNCPTLVNVGETELTDTSVVINWAASGKAASYEVWFGPDSLFQGTNTTGGIRINTTSDSLFIDTLTANSCYFAMVRSFCPVGDTSDWVATTFCAPCPALTAPFYEGFDNMPINQAPSCWQSLTTSNFASFQVENSGTAHSQPNHAVLFNGLDPLTIGVTPRLSDLNTMDKRIRFFASGLSFGTDLIVGTLSQSDDLSSFKPIDTIPITAFYKSYTVNFDNASGYNGTDQYIGIAQGSVNNNFTVSIDDFNYEFIPTCPEPAQVWATAVQGGSATINWSSTSATSYVVEHGFKGFTPGQGVKTTTTNTSVSIQLLPSNAENDIYVKAYCGANDSSNWAGPIQAWPEMVLCDDFEWYSATSFAGQSSLFKNHSLYDLTEVSTAQASSGTKSMRIRQVGFNAFSTMAAEFEKIDSGIYAVKMDVYVPTGGGGLVSVSHDYYQGIFGNFVYDLSSNIYFESNGTVMVEEGVNGSGNSIGSFQYNTDQWNSIEQIIDLDNDSTWIIMNGVYVGLGWQYSLGGNTKPHEFNSVFFSSFTPLGTTADMYIDNFCVEPYSPINCESPDSLVLISATCDSITMSWVSMASSSLIEYDTIGFLPGTGISSGQVSSPFVLTNLSPNTIYDVYIADTCGSDTSLWVGPFNVATISAPLPKASFTFTKSFSGSNQVVSFDASASTNAVDYSWDFGNGNSGIGLNPTETYTVNGVYVAELTVSNACGSHDTTLSISVNIGIEEYALVHEISIYPNPATDQITVETDKNQSGISRIEMFTLSGERIYDFDSALGQGELTHTINIRELTQGMYLLKVYTGMGLAVKKINKL